MAVDSLELPLADVRDEPLVGTVSVDLEPEPCSTGAVHADGARWACSRGLEATCPHKEV